MGHPLILTIFLCHLLLVSPVNARSSCGCDSVPAASQSDQLECILEENKKPFCHLLWFDATSPSTTFRSLGEEIREKLLRDAVPAHSFPDIESLDSPEEYAPQILKDAFEENGIEPGPLEWALGYLALTPPEEYEPKPLLQSLLLLLAPSADAHAAESGLWLLVEFVGKNSNQLFDSLSSGDGEVELPAPEGGVVLNRSSPGCVDLNFVEAGGFNEMHSILVKTRQSMAEGPRC